MMGVFDKSKGGQRQGQVMSDALRKKWPGGEWDVAGSTERAKLV